MKLTLDEVRARLAVVGPIRRGSGDLEWTDTLQTAETFARFGEAVAAQFTQLAERKSPHYTEEIERRRALAPTLFDLLFEAFPPAPQIRK